MKQSASATRLVPRAYERRNFTLRRETTRLLDNLPPKVNRSELVDRAITGELLQHGRAALRRVLEQGYAARAERDLRIVEEWFGVDEEAWEHATAPRRARK
jgi:CopG family transcriptional regulator / antitoxin EndoAI